MSLSHFFDCKDTTGGVPKVETPVDFLISFKIFFHHRLDLLAQFGGCKYLYASALREDLAYKVGRGAYVVGEVGIAVALACLPLRVVQGQGVQVVGDAAVGSEHHVLEGHTVVAQHSVVLTEVVLSGEVRGHLERLFRHLHPCHAVEGVDAHLLILRARQQVPAAAGVLDGVGAHHLDVALGIEFLVAQPHLPRCLYGADDGFQILLTGWRILQQQAVSHCRRLAQHAVHREGGIHPLFHTAVVQDVRIVDAVAVGWFVTRDAQAEHIEYRVPVPVERGAHQGIALRHAVALPFLTELAERHALRTGAQGIDDPDILAKYHSRFHSDCKGTKKSAHSQTHNSQTHIKDFHIFSW